MKKNSSMVAGKNKCTCSAIQKCDMHRTSRLAQQQEVSNKDTELKSKNRAQDITQQKSKLNEKKKGKKK